MSGPTGTLAGAIVARLRADSAVVAALHGARVHDRLPRDLAPPWVALDEIRSTDVSGLDAPLTRHRLTLRAQTRAEPRDTLAALADAVAAALDNASLALDGRRLVLLRVTDVETRVLKDRVTAEAVLRLAAITEPAA